MGGTRKTLISMTAITGVLWIAFVFLVAIGRHTFASKVSERNGLLA
jgi:hypothetical protein